MQKQLFLILILISPHLIAQKYYAEIIDFDTTIDFYGRNIKETNEYEIRINNGTGTKYAKIEIFNQQKIDSAKFITPNNTDYIRGNYPILLRINRNLLRPIHKTLSLLLK